MGNGHDTVRCFSKMEGCVGINLYVGKHAKFWIPSHEDAFNPRYDEYQAIDHDHDRTVGIPVDMIFGVEPEFEDEVMEKDEVRAEAKKDMWIEAHFRDEEVDGIFLKLTNGKDVFVSKSEHYYYEEGEHLGQYEGKEVVEGDLIDNKIRFEKEEIEFGGVSRGNRYTK